MRLRYAQFVLMFAFLAFAFRNVDFEIDGTRVPPLLLSMVMSLAYLGFHYLLLVLLNPRNTVNRGKN